MAAAVYTQRNQLITFGKHETNQTPSTMKITEIEVTETEVTDDEVVVMETTKDESTAIEIVEIVTTEDEYSEPDFEVDITKNRDRLLALISGRSIEVPDMSREYAGWSRGINPGYKSMISLVDAKLESLLLHKKKLDKLKQADFALFAACWWPRAAWDEYVIVTYLSIWLFVWDDEIDMAVGNLSYNYQDAQAFRSATLRFVSHTLGFGDSDTLPPSPNPVINSFKVVADALLQAYTEEQRRTFFDEMAVFLEMSQLEQEYRLGDKVPTVAEYWICRMGTSAVGPCMAVVEYAERLQLPQSIMKSVENKIIWDETNIMISIVNDIVSLKKELSTGVIFSFIPVLCNITSDVQLAVDLALESLHLSVTNLQGAANQLICEHNNSELEADLRRYINVCKEYSTGNLAWSLLTERYGLVGRSRSDGSMSIVL